MPDPAVTKTHNDKAATLRIVMSHPTHPGNIGATARAMKVMGLSDLVLVNPKPGIFPSEEATARAVSADDILAQARVVSCVEDALADCNWVVGTTARLRHIGPPVISPREWAEDGAKRQQQLRPAILFGTERVGLSNEEISLCQALVRIPTNEGFSSLNVAMAVQLFCYEWFVAHQGTAAEAPPLESPLATHAELEGFLGHLRRLSDAAEFFARKNPDAVHRRLKALFARAQLDRNEINILRGLLRDIEKTIAARTPPGSRPLE